MPDIFSFLDCLLMAGQVNIYLTNMDDYAAMNKAYLEVLPQPLPARTCVCVKELPFKTDVGDWYSLQREMLIYIRSRLNALPICKI